ncbi:MAG: alpha/beta hydrolase [Treponema sp.]|jgi:acetyl esterase/lipase|nr:alpha/beta hydrolase [Treponema sp.]
MLSLTYKIAEIIAGPLGNRRIYCLPAEKLAAWLTSAQGRQRTTPPAFVHRKHELREEILGGRPCYIISPKGKTARTAEERAVLFLHGGGYVEEANAVHWQAASQIVNDLGLSLWFPIYPLLTAPGKNGEPAPAGTTYKVEDIVESVLSVYEKMLARYPAGNITVIGDSAGAALSLTLCHHIKARRKELSPDQSTTEPVIPRSGDALSGLPGKLVLVSPAMLTERDGAILAEMKRLEKGDALIGMPFMDAMITLFNMDLSRDNYYNAPLYGDFKGFPETHVFSGTAEIFYPQIVPFVERMKQAGVRVAFYAGEKMMHVWPYIPAAPECRAALKQIVGIIGA